jgi:hypothetical protein
MDLQTFLGAFTDTKQSGDHYMARCGAHEDEHRSLAIKERDGKILVHCFTGCTPEAVIQAAGFSWADLFSDNGTASYNIRDYSGTLRAIHQRRKEGKGKSFTWSQPDGSSGLNGTPAADLPLYGADRVEGWDIDKPVVVAEGEKAALALMAAGVQAVGTVCGASSTPSEDVLAVLTANDVVLWPDADQAGQKHMAAIALRLRNVAARVRIVRWPDAPAKADAADVNDPAKIRRLVEMAVDVPSAIRSLADFSTDPPPPMLLDRLDPTGHTILYGAGGVGKGTYACWLAWRLTKAGHRVLILDYEHHPEEWSRRVFGLGGSEEMRAIRYVAPLSAHWQGQRGPLWDSAADIRSLCSDEGITVCIIDSLAIACAGADVSDPGTPALYAAGLELIELPVLSLAHVNRAGDMAYPFGSAFWHNLARVTWSLEADGVRSILGPRKSNNYLRSSKLSVEVTWTEGLPRELFEKPYGDTIADRAWEVLGAETMSVRDIVKRIAESSEEGDKAVSDDTVRHALVRASKVNPRFIQAGKDWARVR